MFKILTSLRILVAAALIACAGVPSALAQRAQERQAEPRQPTGGVLGLLPADSVTQHVLDAGAEKLAYTATAGTLPLFDPNGEPLARVFYTAYTRNGTEGAQRPVTFVFNGGPGAASAYLHLGLAGPQVVSFGPENAGAEARLSGNPDTWLTFTDLVMIDPIGAGWSRAAKPDKAHEFWSVQADAQVLAKVIALYVARNGRSAAPKYLLGESYGGFRAVKVARALQQEQGLFVAGIVMVSPLLEAGLMFNASRFALGAALQLPSLAAAALDRDNRFTPEALAAAERFAMTDYLVTLAGRPLEGAAADAFYARVAAVSGLPVETVRRTRGFLRDEYGKGMGAARGAVVSAYDASHATPDPYPDSRSHDGPDAVLDGYTLALSGVFVGYARDALGYRTDVTYTLLNREIARKWEWGGRGRAQASIEQDLRELLALNPKLSVLVAHGRSDMVTPYAVSRYVLDHLPPIGAPGRTRLVLYKGGHMFYFDPAARGAFSADAAAFYHREGR